MSVSPTGKRATIIALIVVVLSYGLGIRVAHPHDGLSNGLGSAKSGIVVYKAGRESVTGTKVVISFTHPHASPILGAIAGNEKNSITVQTGSRLEQVQPNQISGRLLLVVPFIGTVINLFGL